MENKNKINNVVTVILAGGLGTRLSEETKKIPKPMIKIGNYPILHHILNIYRKYGFKKFIILGGYKYKLIQKYFKNSKDIMVLNTGLNTMTGGRLYSLKKIISNLENENFFLTYGDGLANINIKKLLKFHIKSKRLATMTIVHPPARFGYAKVKKNTVSSFEEKNQINEGWINGGFFVLNKKIFNFFDRHKKKSKIILEKDILPILAKNNNLSAFKHQNFWQCMDTLRDKIYLCKALKKKSWF